MTVAIDPSDRLVAIGAELGRQQIRNIETNETVVYLEGHARSR